MKVFSYCCCLLLLIPSALSALYPYKDRSFLSALEDVMHCTAGEIAGIINRSKSAKRSRGVSIITINQENILYRINAQFDAFYKTLDNDDECCDHLLRAFIDRNSGIDTLDLPYLSALFMQKSDLKTRLEKWLRPHDVARLQTQYALLRPLVTNPDDLN